MASDRDELTEDPQSEPDTPDEVEAGFDELPGNGESSQPDASDEVIESLRDLVTYLVHHLVDDPELAEISVERRGPSVHVELRLPEDDLGKVIGRGGRIAKAIRTVLLIAGSKHHVRVTLDIES